MTAPGHHPRLFGDPSAALFGVFHPGQGATVRETGVLLCYPGPQEYSMVHWAFRQLAKSLADEGFPVLRFDYHATGDSAGDASEASLARWVDDIEVAVGELRRLGSVRRVALVGMRLGAVLAVRAAARGLPVRDIVLWDPVVDGRAWVSLMERVDRRVHQARHYPVSDVFPEGELFGYPFAPAMRAEAEAIDLLTEPLGDVRRLLLVACGAGEGCDRLATRATGEGIDVSVERVDDPVLYGEKVDPLDTLFAHGASRAIVAFLTGRGRA